MQVENFKLSERLKTVASFLPEKAHFADIGSDHAYLPIYVCKRDKTAKAIAGEVVIGPFYSAEQNVINHQLTEQISVRLGDGLQVLSDDEVEQIVIAGMGGALICSILEAGKAKLDQIKRIIAQPNVEANRVRQWFHNNGYMLTEEVILSENNHIYEVLVADKFADSPYDENNLEKELLFGPFLLKNKSVHFHEKWRQEKLKRLHILAQMQHAKNTDNEKIRIINNELLWIEEELADESHSKK